MSNQPSPAAWDQDDYWKKVVEVITDGNSRKLRPEHYLQRLSAEELDQLRLALSCAGSFAEQQPLCPKMRGGKYDGQAPSVGLLSDLSAAMRQAEMLGQLQVQAAVNAAAKEHCAKLGLNPDLTNAVVRIVGEQALVEKARNQVGSFALNAANVLLNAEAMRTKGRQEEVKINLRKQAEARQSRKLSLEIQKFQFDAAQACLDKLPELQAIRKDSSLTTAQKLDQIRFKLFGEIAEESSATTGNGGAKT